MSLVELVQVRTTDGVRLDGALAVARHADSPASVSTDVVLAVHGTGSNFYSSTLFEGLTPKLLADGIAVLRVNTRGHDVVSMASTQHGPLRLGAALEHVDDCRHDLIAWLEFLASRNYKSVALVGHSLGATKAIFTAVGTAHPALQRLIAISPPRLSHAHYLESERREQFLAHYRMAKEHLAAGHGEAFMEIRT
ncbi:MAG TPA: alpha/beta fold hydrolase, partial [Pirellulales bacterium]